ncbi:GPI mannosyltransferase 2 [Termitomyces sp. J132]|nr:GPI mannosyltransferase 2 [Termitomyces sp. J132]
MIAPRPLFDASPRLQLPSSPYVRWDAIHFLAIAEAGYKYENPSSSISSVSSPYIWPIVLLAVAADSVRILHRLTRLHFPASPAFARLVVLLSLFPSSHATLYLAPYAEPFFTYLSYRGMFHAAQHHWIRATLCFVLVTFFRSNDVLLAGYLVWGLVFQPFLDRKQVRTRLTEPLHLGRTSPIVLAGFTNSDWANCLDTRLKGDYIFVNNWLTKVGLSMAPEKTELMHHSWRQDREQSPPIELLMPDESMVEIQVKETIRILGIHIDRILTFNQYVKKIAQKAKTTLMGSQILANTIKGMNQTQLHTMYRACVMPIMMYMSLA